MTAFQTGDPIRVTLPDTTTAHGSFVTYYSGNNALVDVGRRAPLSVPIRNIRSAA